MTYFGGSRWKTVFAFLGGMAAVLAIWQFVAEPLSEVKQKYEVFSEMAKQAVLANEPHYTEIYNILVQELPKDIRQTEVWANWAAFANRWAHQVARFDGFHKALGEASLKGEAVAVSREDRLCQRVARVLKSHLAMHKSLSELYGVFLTYTGV